MAFNANVPSTTNTIAADLAAVNANWEYVISGDGTGSRVFRLSKVTVEDGTNADTIKITMESIWNGDDIATEDNQDDNDSTGSFYLNADSSEITIKAAGLSGNAVACLGTMIYKNSATDAYPITVCSIASSNDIIIYHKHGETGAAVDLATVFGAAEELSYYIFYLTDA